MSLTHTSAVFDAGSRAMKDKPAVVLLALAGLSLNFLWASGHDIQRCIEIVLLCVSTLIVLGRTARSSSLRPTYASGLLFFFVLFGAASTVFAWSQRHAVYEWSSLVLLGVLAFGIAAELAKTGTPGLRLVLKLTGLACGLYSLRVLLVYAAALANAYQIDMHALAVGFSNVRFLNHTQTALLPLIVLLCLQAPPATMARRVCFVLAAFWWALLFVGEARASILALVAGSGLALLLRRAHARDFLKIMVFSALAGAVLYGLVFILLPILLGLQPIGVPTNVVARTAADPSSGRTLLWKLALELIAAHPWLGVGPHHFAHEGHKIYIGAHPHDWLLQIATEWGVPALLSLLGAMAIGLRSLVASGKRIADGDLPKQQILVALLASCAAILVDGLFSGVLVMPQSQLAIALVVGCAGGWVRSLDTGTPAPAPSLAMRGAGALLAAVALCGLVWSVAPDFVRHAQGEAPTPVEKANNQDGNWPRLWEAGYF
jgi:O-antigen ligase